MKIARQAREGNVSGMKIARQARDDNVSGMKIARQARDDNDAGRKITRQTRERDIFYCHLRAVSVFSMAAPGLRPSARHP